MTQTIRQFLEAKGGAVLTDAETAKVAAALPNFPSYSWPTEGQSGRALLDSAGGVDWLLDRQIEFPDDCTIGQFLAGAGCLHFDEYDRLVKSLFGDKDPIIGSVVEAHRGEVDGNLTGESLRGVVAAALGDEARLAEWLDAPCPDLPYRGRDPHALPKNGTEAIRRVATLAESVVKSTDAAERQYALDELAKFVPAFRPLALGELDDTDSAPETLQRWIERTRVIGPDDLAIIMDQFTEVAPSLPSRWVVECLTRRDPWRGWDLIPAIPWRDLPVDERLALCDRLDGLAQGVGGL